MRKTEFLFYVDRLDAIAKSRLTERKNSVAMRKNDVGKRF